MYGVLGMCKAHNNRRASKQVLAGHLVLATTMAYSRKIHILLTDGMLEILVLGRGAVNDSTCALFTR